jgi:hypothetical protein
MRLTFHVQFSALGYEIMAGWTHQKPDQGGGGGLANRGNDCWRVSTKAD